MLTSSIQEQRNAGLGLQRRHGVAALAADAQQLAARDQESERRRVTGHAGDHLGAVGEQLLEVVEDEQAGPLAQELP